jgi:phosphate starvation-inducible PhoH-like protein
LQSKEPVLFECSDLDAPTLALVCGVENHHLKRIEEAFTVSIRGQMGKWFILGEQRKEAVLILEQLKGQALSGSMSPLGIEDILREHRSSIVHKEKQDFTDYTGDETTLIAGRRNIQGKTPNQRKYLQEIEQKTLTIGVGPAGCGKTYLAVAHAVVALSTHQVEKIILTRPAVEAGENLGFLPIGYVKYRCCKFW